MEKGFDCKPHDVSIAKMRVSNFFTYLQLKRADNFGAEEFYAI